MNGLQRCLLVISLSSLVLFGLSLEISQASEGSSFSNTPSWSQCVEQALRGNAEIQAALESLRSSEQQVRVAMNNFFPQVSTSFTYNYGTSNVLTTTGGATSTVLAGGASTGSQANLNWIVSASQNLLNGFTDRARVDQALAQVKAQEQTLKSVKARVLQDLKVAYSQLLYAQRLLTLQKEIIQRRARNLNLVQLRYQGGRENKGSVLLFQAYLNQARWEELQSKNTIRLAQAQLERVLGLDDEEEIRLQDEVPLSEITDTVDFKSLALLTPEVLQSRAQVESAEAGVWLARSGFLPNLSVNATHGQMGQHWFPNQARWSVGMMLSLSVFNGGRDYYSTQSAHAVSLAAHRTQENTLRVVLARLKQAYYAYQEAKQKVVVDGSFRDAALTRGEVAQVKYNQGLMTFEDWDLIENDVILRERAYILSQRDLRVAEAAWQQAQGIGMTLSEMEKK